VAVWIPIAKALRRYGPVVGPFLLERARRDVQPYWQAYQQARTIDGHLGVWQDDEGKHWVVLNADRTTITGSFPPMSTKQRTLALEHVDRDSLAHHSDTVFARIERTTDRLRDAPSGLKDVPGKVRDQFPGRQGRNDS
jgi:hypothetical protein